MDYHKATFLSDEVCYYESKKQNKTIFSVIVIILIIFLNVGCPHSPNQNNNTEPTNNTEINYKFKISNFPYGSEGLTVVASIKKDDESKEETIGIVPADTTYLEKTVKVPSKYDQLEIRFLDDSDAIKYYIPVKKSFLLEQRDVYEITGDYYFYYKTTQYKTSTNPLVATTESKIQELQFGIKYDFDASKNNYLVWHVGNVIDKIISISKEDFDDADLYISHKKDDIMLYKAQKTTGDSYECKTNDIYIMLRPKAYFNTEKTVTCSVTFTDLSAEIEKCLEIDQSILASDGKIYASGTNSTNRLKKILWCIDPSDGTKTEVQNFYNEIITIRELDEGKLYISHDTSISIYNLATKETSSLVSDLRINPKEFINYKDGKIVVVGKSTSSSSGEIVLVEKSTGSWSQVTPLKYSLSHGDMELADSLLYISDLELFIHNRYYTSPNDIAFTIFDNDTLEEPKYHSYDSRYHGDYNVESPLKIVGTSPLKILSAGGCVFRVDKELIDSVSTDDSNYYTKIQNWLLCEGIPYRSYVDCIFTDEYIYYMNNNNSYNSNEAFCSIEKCSKDTPKQVIRQETYEREKGIQLYSYDGKIYLLTNGTEAIHQGDYQVFLHELNF